MIDRDKIRDRDRVRDKVSVRVKRRRQLLTPSGLGLCAT